MNIRHLQLSAWIAGLLAGVLLFLPGAAAQAESPASALNQETEAYCLGCHSEPSLSLTLPSGEVLSMYIDPLELAGSVHSPQGIECEACHTEITTYPHPALPYQDARSLSRAYFQTCQKCHPDIYTQTMDSMHFQAAEAGNLAAPICTDCHGVHDIGDPDEPRARISTTCSRCHEEIYQAYQSSIHGQALIEEGNPDVPVCTDCHGVHRMPDPRTDQFRIDSPDLCAGCHADAELMSKYDLPADVYELYELSWHGVDVKVYKARWPSIWHDTAVCTDCHGVHDIFQTDDPRSSVNPVNLLATCQKCHAGASENWTGAWTGHNQISLQETPFLYYTDVFYSTLVPVVLWGLVVYVVLQIVRGVAKRIRSTLS
jgi:predicted CXXCH cytochrome family protein